MYNRILNRPMFKLGGDTVTAQGTGITSGLDTPRNNYYGGGTIGGGRIHGNPMGNRTGFDNPTLSEQLSAIDVGVPESTRKRAFWSGIGQGFSNADTLGEALSGAVKGQEAILGPAEAKAGERKFELEKIGVIAPYERETAEIIQAQIDAGNLEIAKIQFDPARTATGQKIKELKLMLTNKTIARDEFDMRMKDIISNTSLGHDITVLAAAITRGTGMNPTDAMTAAIAAVAAMQEEIYKVPVPKTIENNASGGRVGYQFGATNQGVQPMQASLNVDETIKTPQGTVQEDVSVQEKTQSSIGIPYQEFRAKMPPEVDDEIVQLIYFNEDAFADFAQITSQADVYAFNNKWGVSLVLPMDTETT